MTTPDPDTTPSPPPITPLGLAALAVSGACTLWLGVEIWLRVEGAPEWQLTASLVIAIVLAVIVVILAVLAWRQDRKRGGLWGVLAIAMATSDRIVLALVTLLGGLG